MTQAADPGAPVAPKGRFWWGPVASETQAKSIISWAACANLLFLMAFSSINVVATGGKAAAFVQAAVLFSFFGFPSPFLWIFRSRAAVILSSLLRLFFVYFAIAAPVDEMAAKIVVGAFLALLFILDWRGLRATLAWHRLKKGRTSAVAAVFE